MTVILGDYAAGPNVYTPGAYYNQIGSAFTVPETGVLTRLGALLSNALGVATARLCVWDASSGALLAQSGTFTVDWGTWPPCGRFEMDISPLSVTAGQAVVLGFWATSDGTWPTSIECETSGAMRLRMQGNGGPGSFASYATAAYTADAYAFLTPSAPTGVTVKVRRGGVWVDAPVRIRRGGAWVDATAVRIRRGGSWHDVS